MKNVQKLVNPFVWIAGSKALTVGAVGLVASAGLSVLSGVHANGLLQYGPSSAGQWYVHCAELLVIWLVPALLFYLGGQLLSRSHIRWIDVLGTVLFAQLPLLLTWLIYLLPSVQALFRQDLSNLVPEKLLLDSQLMRGVYLLLLAFLFVVWMVVWMVNALRVSCNLKGWRLAVVAVVGIGAGDIITRLLISWLRSLLTT